MIWKILGYVSLITGLILLFLINSEWSFVLIIFGGLLLNKVEK